MRKRNGSREFYWKSRSLVKSVIFLNHSFLSTGFQSQTDPIRDARAPEIAGFEPKFEFPTG